MSAADWLNADITIVGAHLQQGLAWWVGELRALLSPLTHPGGRGRPALVAHRQADGAYQIRRSGQVEHMQAPGDRPVKAALAMPDDIVLIRRLVRPPLPDRDLRRMTVLDLDRLTPFSSDSIYYDVTIQPTPDGRQREIRLSAAPKAVVDSLLAEAAGAGVDATAVIVFDGELVIDFMPAIRADTRSASQRFLGWGIVVGLVALNLAIAVWKDARATDDLRASVAAQQPLIERVMLTRRRVEALQAQARDGVAARSRGEPLRVLSALSHDVPAAAWVQRLSWDGASVRLVGQEREALDLLGALRKDAIFANPRASDGASPPSGAGFDVVADVVPAGPAKR